MGRGPFLSCFRQPLSKYAPLCGGWENTGKFANNPSHYAVAGALSERVSSFEPVYMDLTEHIASHERTRRDFDGAPIPLSFGVTAYGRHFDLRLHKVGLDTGVLARVNSRGSESTLATSDLPIYEGYVSGIDRHCGGTFGWDTYSQLLIWLVQVRTAHVYVDGFSTVSLRV